MQESLNTLKSGETITSYTFTEFAQSKQALVRNSIFKQTDTNRQDSKPLSPVQNRHGPIF
jgi:hypothetical protein